MRYHKIITLLLCCCLGFPFILTAQNNSKLIQVLMLVKKAKQYVLQHGRIQAVSAFNNPTGKFRHGEYYIFSMVCNDGENNGFSSLTRRHPNILFKTVYMLSQN